MGFNLRFVCIILKTIFVLYGDLGIDLSIINYKLHKYCKKTKFYFVHIKM